MGKIHLNPVYIIMLGILILTLGLFLCPAVIGLFYQFLFPAPPPLPIAAQESPISLIPTSTLTPTPTPTRTPTPTYTPTPTLTPTYTPTPLPTSTYTPTPTPLPAGFVAVDALNVRWGPGTDYGYVGAVYKDDKVVILGSNSDKSWLKIELSEGKSGWVNAHFIDIFEGNVTLAVIPTPPLPPITFDTTGLILQDFSFGRELDINAEDRSVDGQLGPYQEHWYSFVEDDPETVMLFMFKPNVNFFADHFIGYNIEAFLYSQNQIGVEWLPGQPIPEGLPQVANGLPHIGAGARPGVDWDGDLGTGELVWRGGPLVPGTHYYFRFVNTTPKTIEYCLIPGEIRYWACH